MEENEAYRAVTVMRVVWDNHGDGELVRELKIPRRSTLVMFSKGREVGRVVAQTGVAAIETLFKAAIAESQT